MRFSQALSAFAFVLALALVGCGGGDSATTGEATTVAAKPKDKAQSPKPKAKAPKPKPQSRAESASPTTTPSRPHDSVGQPVPGEKAPAPGVPVTPAGDNSVQAFGAEGEADQSEQATANLMTYLSARAAGEWAAACAATSAEFKSELAALIERANPRGDAQKPRGCVETLSALFGKAPEGALEQAAQVGQVLSFRVKEDGYAYLIFKAPQGTVKFIAMAEDDGTWKVNTFEPTELSEARQGSSQ